MPQEAMNEVGRAGAIGLTLGLSLLHAALPNHWLPFVLVARTLKWTRRRTLAVLAFAGGGHVLATSGLGIFVWLVGSTVFQQFDPESVHHLGAISGGSLLILLGLVYLVRHLLGKKHSHSHAHGEVWHGDPDHDHEHHDHNVEKPVSERGAVLTLFLAMTLSPCETVVAAFLSGWHFGFVHVLLLALASSVATCAAMFALVVLTLAGMERLRLPWLDRHEMSLTGAILVGLGLVVLLLPT